MTILSVFFDTPDCSLRGSGHLLRTCQDGMADARILKLAPAADHRGTTRTWEAYVPRDALLSDLFRDSPIAELLARPEEIGEIRPAFSASIERDFYLFDKGDAVIEAILDDCLVFNESTRHRIVGVEFKLLKGSVQALVALLRELNASAPLFLSPPLYGEQGYWLLNLQPLRPIANLGFELAPDMKLPEAFAAFGQACTSALSHNLALLLAGGGPNVLHQGRVCIRRLRTVLSLFKSALSPKRRQALQLELKWASDLLGRTRELDVLIERVLPPAIRDNRDAPGFEALREAVRHIGINAHDATLLGLQSLRMFELNLELARCFGSLGTTGLSDEWFPRLHNAEAAPFVASRLRGWLKSLLIDTESMSLMRPAALHRVRVRVKKLRYGVEGLALLSPSGCAELTPFLHAMQEALGKVNDGRISRELVLGYAASTLPRNSGERASVSAAGVVAATCVIGEASMIADAQAARDGLAACRESLLANGWLILDFP